MTPLQQRKYQLQQQRKLRKSIESAGVVVRRMLACPPEKSRISLTALDQLKRLVGPLGVSTIDASAALIWYRQYRTLDNLNTLSREVSVLLAAAVKITTC